MTNKLLPKSIFDIDDLSPEELVQICELGSKPAQGTLLKGLGIAMVFQKPSARTRNSTEMAVYQLGGHPVAIMSDEVGIDERETAEDVARTLGSFYGAICARVIDHQVLVRMDSALQKAGVSVPVINLLSDLSHPCQAIADIMTINEHLFKIPSSERIICYLGDANNIARSLAKAVLAAGMKMRIASPEKYSFGKAQIQAFKEWASSCESGGSIEYFSDPKAAANGAHVLYTDVWTSMGQKESSEKHSALQPYQINTSLLSSASTQAFVLHCLPAHRGQEITAEIMDSPRQRIFEQVRNRQAAMVGLFSYLAIRGST